jgi:hypothetical protein
MPKTGNPAYQIQETDRDLLELSARMDLNYQEVKRLNPSITSISPGQYINLPPKQPPGYNPLEPVGNALSSTWRSLGNLAGDLAGRVTGTQYGFNTNFANIAFGKNPNLPNPYGGLGNTPYGPTQGPPAPRQTPAQALIAAGVPPSVVATVLANTSDYFDPKNEARADLLKRRLQTATDPSQLPQLILASDAAHAGFSPAQMLQAGYVLRNREWVFSGAASGTGTGGPSSGNNWQTNDSLHLITFNRNAKNKRSRFQTTLKWAKNAWKRKKLAAKGHVRTQPAAEIRPDSPSTTLDLILGS